MRHQDKLAEYIRKEVDSIPYEGEDQMWEEFQKTNSTQLATWNKSNYFFPILLALLMVTVSSVIYFQYNHTTGLATNNNTQSSENKATESMHEAVASNATTNKLNLPNNENSILATTEKNETSTLKENDFSLTKNLSSTNSDTPKNSNIRNKKSVSQEPIIESNIFHNNDNSSNNLISENGLSLSPTPSSQLIEYQNSSATKRVSLEKFEVAEALELRSKTSDVTLLESKLSLLELMNFEDRLSKIDKCPPFKRRNEFFVRALFSASTNSIYKSSFDIGKVKKLSRNSGLKYSLGLSVTDGYSLSQDSIYIVNGLYPEEHIREKDLDYLISPFIATEYYVKRNHLKASLGTRISYASFSKFNGYRRSTITQFNGHSWSSGSTEHSNIWTAINRLQFEGIVNLSYRFRNLELGFSASKRFNKLIKDNIAERRKSNVPIQIGINLSRYF